MLFQLADTCHFFIHGMDLQLWASAPEVLKPPPGSAAAGSGRPQGGLRLTSFTAMGSAGRCQVRAV
jgi:hypothetical protein